MSNISNSLLKIMQKEYIRRNLIKYFSEKGYDNFLVKPYPPSVADIGGNLDSLNGFIEVQNFLEDVNIYNNSVKVGWNIFVLGNKRIFLGYTIHEKISDIEREVNTIKQHDGPITIKSIIESIIEFLGSSNKLSDIYKSEETDIQITSKIGNTININKPIPNFKRQV